MDYSRSVYEDIDEIYGRRSEGAKVRRIEPTSPIVVPAELFLPLSNYGRYGDGADIFKPKPYPRRRSGNYKSVIDIQPSSREQVRSLILLHQSYDRHFIYNLQYNFQPYSLRDAYNDSALRGIYDNEYYKLIANANNASGGRRSRSMYALNTRTSPRERSE